VEANETVHKVTLEGLERGTPYAYRVVSREILKLLPYHFEFGETITSEVFHFAMPDSGTDSVSFVVFNDMHESPELRQLLFPVAREHPFDLAVLNGDILNYIHDLEQPVKQLAEPYAELMAGRAPFVLVRGNHETRGYHARHLLEYVATSNGRYYFSLDWGPVHFVVLDSGEDKPDDHEEYGGLVDFEGYRDEQTEWLRREIHTEAFKDAPFRVVLTHIPLFAGGYGGDECQKRWAPLLNEGRVDLHLSGHTHRHAILAPVPGEHDYPIVIGGGSKPAQATVIHVTATTEQLDVTVRGGSGKVLATHQVMRRER
jgi:predicted MPP superfamily phosphohydrolase